MRYGADFLAHPVQEYTKCLCRLADDDVVFGGVGSTVGWVGSTSGWTGSASTELRRLCHGHQSLHGTPGNRLRTAYSTGWTRSTAR